MDDMSKMGLEVISFTIREVRDKNEYITNMGRPDVARIRRDAEIATAEAERDTAIRRAIALREAAVAKASADQERVLAETLSLAKQAEAQRDLDIQKAQFTESARRQEAQADKAYELQTNVMQQKVIAEQVKVQQIEKQEQVKVQEAEILRHEKELIATVLKGAEIERQRIENLANAEKSRITMEAEGRAAATRLQGEAEANIIFQKGEAEAKAMNVKAEAYQEYNQAAVVDKLLTGLPEVVRALASPLANVDKITIVSTGNGDAAGMNKITGLPFGATENVFMANGPDRIGRVYKKALYREYTDATFKTLVPRPAAWAHLGMLGPPIHAVVGDTIKVVFKNNTPYPASVHPHGVLYDKASEGAPYDDGTGGAGRAGSASCSPTSIGPLAPTSTPSASRALERPASACASWASSDATSCAARTSASTRPVTPRGKT